MKPRVRIGDRVVVNYSDCLPGTDPRGVVIRKDPIIRGKVIISHWYVVRHDGESEPRLYHRGQIELLKRAELLRPEVVLGSPISGQPDCEN